ncbi:MAG: hypothetical protein AAFR62_22150 [Cyanobacteria bacterium J06629_2]
MEDFLAYQEFMKNQPAFRLHLLQAYRSRRLDRHRQTRLNRYRSASALRQHAASVDSAWYEYYLEREAYALESANKRNQKHNLPDQEAKLLRALMAVKLRQACETLAHLRIARMDYKIPLLEEVQQLANQSNYYTDPSIRLFYLATLLYQQSNDDVTEIFQELKAGLETNINQFPREDQRNLLVLAINHGLRQSNAGKSAYLRQTLDLYQLGLRTKILYDRGRIGVFTFNNIIGIALRLGENEWAATFLEDNVRYLPPDQNTEIESLNRARLAFQRRDYSTTLQHLQTADYRDFIHHMTARVMQLKIFFERDDYNLLTSLLRSTRTLIKRRKSPGYHERNYLNILKFTESLLKLLPNDKVATAELIEQIRATEPCTEKEWLLERLSKG